MPYTDQINCVLLLFLVNLTEHLVFFNYPGFNINTLEIRLAIFSSTVFTIQSCTIQYGVFVLV